MRPCPFAQKRDGQAEGLAGAVSGTGARAEVTEGAVAFLAGGLPETTLALETEVKGRLDSPEPRRRGHCP
jgi:hypothetical protein